MKTSKKYIITNGDYFYMRTMGTSCGYTVCNDIHEATKLHLKEALSFKSECDKKGTFLDYGRLCLSFLECQ